MVHFQIKLGQNYICSRPNLSSRLKFWTRYQIKVRKDKSLQFPYVPLGLSSIFLMWEKRNGASTYLIFSYIIVASCKNNTMIELFKCQICLMIDVFNCINNYLMYLLSCQSCGRLKEKTFLKSHLFWFVSDGNWCSFFKTTKQW